MKVGLVQKLLSVLNKVLEKLGRYDEGTMMGGFLGMMVSRNSNHEIESKFLTLTLCESLNILRSDNRWFFLIFQILQNKKGVTGSGVDEGKKYISFVRGNMDQIDKKITDDLWALSAIEVRNISNLVNFPVFHYWKCRFENLSVEYFYSYFRNGILSKFNEFALG